MRICEIRGRFLIGVLSGGCVKTQSMRAALGFAACQSKKGNSLIIRLLPLQGVGLVWRIFTQGVALGYVLFPLWGVLLVSFDTPPP